MNTKQIYALLCEESTNINEALIENIGAQVRVDAETLVKARNCKSPEAIRSCYAEQDQKWRSAWKKFVDLCARGGEGAKGSTNVDQDSMLLYLKKHVPAMRVVVTPKIPTRASEFMQIRARERAEADAKEAEAREKLYTLLKLIFTKLHEGAAELLAGSGIDQTKINLNITEGTIEFLSKDFKDTMRSASPFEFMTFVHYIQDAATRLSNEDHRFREEFTSEIEIMKIVDRATGYSINKAQAGL